MRRISYECDRCGKPIGSKTVVKLNISMQNGANTVEKSTKDFCKTCFMRIKSAYLKAMKQEEITNPVDTVSEAKQNISIQEPEKVPDTVSVVQEPEKVPDTVSVVQEPEKISEPEKKQTSREVDENELGLKLGPINAEDKQEILRLYVEEDMQPDDIAAKMNRLPRGIKRAINSATKSGEIDKMRAAFKRKQDDAEAQNAIHNLLQGTVIAVPDDEADVFEGYTGSGASNAGIKKDAYTVPPRREVLDGKKYDIGCIIALARAGWSSEQIADEKHYDESVVIDFMNKYL